MNMRMYRGIAPLFFASILLAQTTAPNAGSSTAKKQFLGAWSLAMLEEPDTNGNIHQADATGLLVFSPDGHLSVQVMYRNKSRGGQAGPVQYAKGGYEASFGRYQIDDDQTFTFHVDGAMVRTLIGKDLPRTYKFSSDQLVVTSTDPKEHWKVTWKRY